MVLTSSFVFFTLFICGKNLSQRTQRFTQSLLLIYPANFINTLHYKYIYALYLLLKFSYTIKQAIKNNPQLFIKNKGI
ncbi:MAG: hypothetical protein EAY66_07855 [Sphingobacteriales bacterium]|nr:MAG: hypothetical protein EAY66_07855 [Sphingobacteriales bacterium]